MFTKVPIAFRRGLPDGKRLCDLRCLHIVLSLRVRPQRLRASASFFPPLGQGRVRENQLCRDTAHNRETRVLRSCWRAPRCCPSGRTRPGRLGDALQGDGREPPKTRQYAFANSSIASSTPRQRDEPRDRSWDHRTGGLPYRKLVKQRQATSPKDQNARRAAETEAERRRKESPEERKKSIQPSHTYRMPYDKLTGVFHLRHLGERESTGVIVRIEASPN